MKKNTTDSSSLQAPSFEEARLFTLIDLLNTRLLLTDKQIDLINKRLDLLDHAVLNIPQENK